MRRRIAMIALLALTAAVGCRPKGEVVRYMARPPATIRPAPQDGTYLLYPGVDKPPVLAEELKQGDPIGFQYEDTAYGKRIVAVAGQESRLPLASGERYTWLLGLDGPDQNVVGDGKAGRSVMAQRRLDIARRSYEQAERDLKTAQQNHDAAKRRLDAAQEAANDGGARPTSR